MAGDRESFRKQVVALSMSKGSLVPCLLLKVLLIYIDTSMESAMVLRAALRINNNIIKFWSDGWCQICAPDRQGKPAHRHAASWKHIARGHVCTAGGLLI